MAETHQVVDTQIVPRQDAIPIPELEVSRPDVFTAIAETDKDSAALVALRARAESIEVTDVTTYSQLGSVLTEVRLINPDSHWTRLDTFIKRLRAFYDMQVNRPKNERTLIENIIKPKLKAWEQAELEATKKEQVSINKTNAKEGLPEATVKPALPSIGGYRRSTTYHATFDTPADFNKLLKAWKNAKNKAVWEYYRQFITFNAKVLNEEARAIKDPKQLAKNIPGCRAWSE